MKKLLCVLLTGVLMLSLCACSNTADVEEEVNTTSTSTTTTTTTTTTMATTTTTTINMGMSLQEAFAIAVKQYTEDPTNNRVIGELQPETQEIINIDGKFYQSYVASNVDIRYIWLSNAEMPEPHGDALWDWVSVGTSSNYSLDLLGTMDEGRK